MPARSVVITAAAAGVGAACARKFAAAGDRLLLADSDEDAGKALRDELAEAGAEVCFVHADNEKRLDVHNVVAEAIDTYGRIDVLAHMAMANFAAPFLETSEEDFDRIVASNIKGAFLINQAVAKQFIKQIDAEDVPTERPGVIVNIASVEAVTASGGHVVFAATQGALQQMTKAIAMSLSDYGIRANTVAMGLVKGEGKDISAEGEKAARARTPLKRIGDPGEVADVVQFLASDSASYMTGQTLFVDGGSIAQNVAQVDIEDED